jgi:carbamate kinase
VRRERVVVALGGNALLPRGAEPEAGLQRDNVKRAAEQLAPIARSNSLIITHGNGPQVGMLALQAEADASVAPYPLDILDAETQGMIGYLLLEALGNTLESPEEAVALLTRVVVASDDPAFATPTKFIGAVMDETSARRAAHERGWAVAPDGDRWRRVVPSPVPQEVLEAPLVRSLAEQGFVVLCGGGGGIPLVREDAGLHGIEAVVDKDLTASLLAEKVGADRLVMLTDVPGIAVGYGTAEQRWMNQVHPRDLAKLVLPDGSMGPKALAAIRFVEATDKEAVIASLADAAAACVGAAGTIVVHSPERVGLGA